VRVREVTSATHSEAKRNCQTSTKEGRKGGGYESLINQSLEDVQPASDSSFSLYCRGNAQSM
jgi:hypothetical protein